MKHVVGEQRTLWIASLSDPALPPWSVEAELGPCHGGEAIGWRATLRLYVPLLLVADADGMPQAKGVFFSEADALTWCIARLEERVAATQSQIAAFARRREEVDQRDAAAADASADAATNADELAQRKG